MGPDPAWTQFNPVKVVCAPLDALKRCVRGKTHLLVTSPGFSRRGVVDHIINLLAPNDVIIWDQVKPNPELEDLDHAANRFREMRIEGVIGLGGGSALDAAKVLAKTLPTTTLHSLGDVFRKHKEVCWAPRLHLVLIPTTAGTGAEVTPFATVWDRATNRKHSLSDHSVYADIALLDVNLTMSLQEDDTLYPALDSMSHALESLWNKNKTPVSAAFAWEALKLSNNALPKVLGNPHQVDARVDLQTSSLLSGLAISQTKTAIAHSISYPLTIQYGVPHGLAVGFTLANIIETYFLPPMQTSAGIIIRDTQNLINSLNLKKRIKKYLTTDEALSLVGQMSDKSRAKNFVEPMGTESITEILYASLN